MMIMISHNEGVTVVRGGDDCGVIKKVVGIGSSCGAATDTGRVSSSLTKERMWRLKAMGVTM